MPNTKLTILNTMAGQDFPAALQLHHQLSLHHVDLKSHILGKDLLDLTPDEAKRAADLIAAANLKTWCLSSPLFDADAEIGESAFRQLVEPKLDHAAKLITIFKPQKFRLVAAQSSKRSQFHTALDALDFDYPWLIPLYAQAIKTLAAAGTQVTIENESHNALLINPEDFVAFFHRLNVASPVKATFTWNIQNMWQMGFFPTHEACHKLKPLIAYYRVAGGIANSPGGPLAYASSLKDASWPVVNITREILKDHPPRVICLDAPLGQPKPGYDYTNLIQRDLEFLRNKFPEIS